MSGQSCILRRTSPRFATAVVVALLATVNSIALAERGDASSSGEVRTFAYYANGKLAGWVRRDGTRRWWASNRRRAAVDRDLKGGYKLTTGGYKSPVAYAWPAKRGDLSRYLVRGPLLDPNGWILERVNPSRWNVYYVIDFHGYSKRLEGFTKGPDGAASGLAFAEMDEALLPK
jgi:hypothetical protein